MDETLEFKVIEFNKDAKKIVVSHLRTFEEGEDKPTLKTSKPKSVSNSSCFSRARSMVRYCFIQLWEIFIFCIL